MQIEAQQCNAVTLLYPERVMRPGTHKAVLIGSICVAALLFSASGLLFVCLAYFFVNQSNEILRGCYMTPEAGHKSRFGGNKLERARTFGRTPKIEIDLQIINSTNIADEIQ